MKKDRYLKKLLMFPLMLTLSLSLASCSDVNLSIGSMSESVSSINEGPYKIYMVDSFVGYFYCNDVFEGAQDAAKNLEEVELYRVGPDHIDETAQIEAFNKAIEDGADAIFVTTLRPDMWTETINSAIEKGIPVVCYDCDDPDSERLAFYGTVNYRAGYNAGLSMIEAAGDDAQIAIMTGDEYAQNNIERIVGFQDAMENESNAEIVCIEPTYNLLSEAEKKAEEILTKHPEVGAIFASSGSDAQAAAEVISEKSSGRNIKIIGFDNDEATMEYIRNGKVYGTVVQNTHAMGYGCVMYLYDVLTGELPMEKAENGTDMIDTGTVFVTKENIDTYMDELEWPEE